MQVMLGLKGSADKSQYMDRLQYHPDVFEFFTQESDFTKDGLKNLRNAIGFIQDNAIKKIILHHPMRFHHDIFTELIAPEKNCPELYSFIEQSTIDLLQIAFDLNVQVLVHGAYLRQTPKYIAMYPSFEDAREAAFTRMDHFSELGKNHIMFENTISPIFSFGNPKDENEILSHNYRLAFDTSHCFIAEHGSNEMLIASMKHLMDATVHYHLVDSMGIKHDSLILGEGKIDWKRVLPLLDQNSKATCIYEINLADPTNANEQIKSHNYLVNLANEISN
ncbi:TIM barrel protein [Ligilactobacillus cholophilus]|uniref:TIM barrel protein n=1 Tax=Ligilactobacillus cholophilus TaxID=3050131 RepID=UPI0025B0C6A7|nr:TIM barrel protein [Ligilactobacillus cholophilus]